MKGFLRTAAVSLPVHLGDVNANETEILIAMENLRMEGVQLAVFPELCLCGVPEGSCARIRGVSYSGLPVQLSQANGCVRASIPLQVQLCDSCGRCFSACAETQVEIRLPCCCMHRPGQLFLVPEVRLLCAEPRCGGCFQAKLQIVLNLYVLSCEIMGRCKPACPQLPLYPPPIQPRW